MLSDSFGLVATLVALSGPILRYDGAADTASDLFNGLADAFKDGRIPASLLCYQGVINRPWPAMEDVHVSSAWRTGGLQPLLAMSMITRWDMSNVR